MANLQSLKKKSMDQLTKALADTQKNKVDERFWQPEVDKAGNGFAVIRFLDAPEVDGNDAVPFVHYFSHGFRGPTGQWYIENSLTTLGQDDPVSEYNSALWNSGIEANKNLARAQKRKLNYISNILVVTDSEHPENEGKVFLFRYGKKIFDKIKEMMEPDPRDKDAVKVNPFNMWEGANLKLSIRNVEGYRNYDKSAFLKQSAIAESDAEIEKIWKSEHSLKEFVDPSKFKSYDELKARLDKVLGATQPVVAAEAAEVSDELPSASSSSDDDGLTDIFSKLAEE